MGLSSATACANFKPPPDPASPTFGDISVLISGSRRGLTPKLIADLRRRSTVEAEIGHMKTDGRLSRCPLKGPIGDAVVVSRSWWKFEGGVISG